MKFTTTTFIDGFNEEVTVIQMITEDGTVWAVPTDPANSDYQAYLASQENN